MALSHGPCGAAASRRPPGLVILTDAHGPGCALSSSGCIYVASATPLTPMALRFAASWALEVLMRSIRSDRDRMLGFFYVITVGAQATLGIMAVGYLVCVIPALILLCPRGPKAAAPLVRRGAARPMLRAPLLVDMCVGAVLATCTASSTTADVAWQHELVMMELTTGSTLGRAHASTWQAMA